MAQSQSQQNVLKRSHKADFSGVNRERSFVKNNNNLKDKRRSQTFVKPAIELYRPPNVRSDVSPSAGTLNVHAKEFTMVQEHRDGLPMLQSSKSSGNLNQIFQQHHYQHQQPQQHYQQQQNTLQHSKSSGSILKSPQGMWQFIPVPSGLHMPTHAGLLHHSTSTSTLLQHLHNQQQQIAAAAAAAAAQQQQQHQHRVSFHHHHHATPSPALYGQQAFTNVATGAAIYSTAAEQAAAAATPTVVGFRGAASGLMYNGGVAVGQQHVNGNAMLLKRSKSFTTAGADVQPTAAFPSYTSRQHLKNLSNISELFATPTPITPKQSNLHQTTSHTNTNSSNVSQQLTDLIASYPSAEQRASLRLATVDPQQLPARTLIDLVRVIMERLVREGMTYAESAAKLCVAVVEREREVGGGVGAFGESVLNTCQQWYQERDKLLRSIKPSPTSDGTRFTAFMWFLTELFTRLRRHQHHTVSHPSTDPPTDLTLLSVLAKCCQACVAPPIRCLAETECLFFVLTSIGRELEAELPQQLDQLMAGVRDGFLMAGSGGSGGSNVRKTLLQLIELHASSWQLTGSGVLYYYPRSK